jgi:hypothetical protein
MTPTQAQIDAGVAKAKQLIAGAPIPAFIANQITDEEIAQAVSEIVTAAFAVPGDAA